MPNTQKSESTLYYIHDPMCSWCWAFRPAWLALQSQLSGHIKVVNSLGGLAADSDEPMQESLQKTLQKIWARIQVKVPNTEFNFDFWTNCQPRRSTYAACRAVIVAKQQGNEFEEKMILGIQQAYYLQAKNPSDNEVLIQIAQEIGLDKSVFTELLDSPDTQQKLLQQINFNQELGANAFPSLILETGSQLIPIPIDYLNPENMLKQIQTNL